MTDPDNRPKPPQSINVGIYGCTKAGKTRFLFHLLSGWERDRRLLKQSETCQTFLATVEAEIKKLNGSAPTVATTEGIEVKVRRKGETPWELVLRDLRGELLAGELDEIASLTRKGFIPTHVQKCDAFLFFFDPACSENPDDIDKHHERELKRAELFIEYILRVRQNQYLPIVFVQTHLDLWEHDDVVRARSRQWAEQVNGKLQALYATHLRRHHPVGLVDLTKTSIAVSSVRGAEGEKVVERLYDLVRESGKFRADDRKKVRPVLWAGVVVVLLLVAGAVLMATFGPAKSKQGGGTGGKPAVEWTERDVLTQLDDFEGLLRAHPPGPQLPSPEEAKKINQHLRWMVVRASPLQEGGGTPATLSEKTQTRIRSDLDACGELVATKAEAKANPPAERALLVATYLEDLPDLSSVSANLGRIQSLYWPLLRSVVIDEVAGVLRRRDAVASPATDTLAEVIQKLRGLEQEVGRCKVFGPQPRQELVQEIQTAATFCEDRKNSKAYPAKFRVVSANFTTAGHADLAWRALTVRSPGQEPRDFGLEPSRKSESECAFSTAKPSYDLSLGLGSPVVCELFVLGADGGWRLLNQFDLLSEHGPLTALGLPLPLAGKTEVLRQLQWEGYELKLEFSHFPPLPPLLVEAGQSVKEKRP